MAGVAKGKKSRSSYNWFSDANWDENEVAQRKVDLFIDSLCLKENDKLLLIIDDTYNEKKEIKQMVWANFTIIVKKPIFGVTISLPLLSNQKDYFIPHKAKMYIKNDDENENLKQKWRLPFEEIIKPLVVPKSIDLYIVFDSWWFSSDLFSKCLKLGHNIVSVSSNSGAIEIDALQPGGGSLKQR